MTEELDTIGGTDELEIASIGEDGTLGASTTIWVVRLGENSTSGPCTDTAPDGSGGTQVRHEGRIRSGGVEKDVTFVDVGDGDDALTGRIDDAYHAKYDRRYPPQYVDDCLTPKARAATLKLVARE